MKRVLAFAALVSLLLACCPDITYATVPQELSIEQSISLAIQNSNELRQAAYDIDAAEVTRDEVWELYNAFLMKTYIPGMDLYVSVPTGQDPEGQVYAANFAWIAKQKNYDMKFDSVVTSVYQKYYGVLQAMQEVKVKSLLAEQSLQQLAVTEARLNAGLDSPLMLTKVRAQAVAANAALETSKKNLEKAYTELNELLGLPDESQPKLTDTVSFEALNINNNEDPEGFINAITDNSPPVWIAIENVRLIKQTYGMNQFDSYELDKANLNKAQADMEVTREKIRQTARQLYYTVKDLEEKYDAALQQVKAAEDYARITHLQYEVGLVTPAQVTAADASLAVARQGLFALKCNHDLLKKVLYKPWTASVILSSMSGTTGSNDNGSGATDSSGNTGMNSVSSGQMGYGAGQISGGM